ncbi:MAG: hypothetical protein GXY86_04410 [Firmicutes bacterium]|nr:hypothetical protein [Bacillota bacterium]
MDGLSKITYKGKEIIYVDYSGFKFDKIKTFNLVYGSANEYMKYPFKSVLAIVNLTNLYFDNDIINAFKVTQEAATYHEKKVALIGIKGLQVLAYNYIIHMKYRDMVKVFNNISDAKEWLVSDYICNFV